MPPAFPAEWHSVLTLPFSPSYLTAVTSDDDVVVYMESTQDGRSTSYGVAFDAYGARASGVVTLVEDFSAPFGEVVLASHKLLIPVFRGDGDARSWELWAWQPGESASRLVSCALPTNGHGQVFGEGDVLFVFYEGLDEGLWGFDTSLATPSCPSADDLVRIASAPLPARYRLDWLDDRFVLSGQAGDSYSVFVFGPDFVPQRRLRLASRAAPDAADLRVYDLDGVGLVAIYGARVEGARDLYIARLNQLSAGPLTADRIVSSADVERNPQIFPLGDYFVISWSVHDAVTGERFEMGALVADLDASRTSGEVLWRHSVVSSPLFTSIWTRAGLLRFWIDESHDSPLLVASPYRPTFWR